MRNAVLSREAGVLFILLISSKNSPVNGRPGQCDLRLSAFAQVDAALSAVSPQALTDLAQHAWIEVKISKTAASDVRYFRG